MVWLLLLFQKNSREDSTKKWASLPISYWLWFVYLIYYYLIIAKDYSDNYIVFLVLLLFLFLFQDVGEIRFHTQIYYGLSFEDVDQLYSSSSRYKLKNSPHFLVPVPVFLSMIRVDEDVFVIFIPLSLSSYLLAFYVFLWRCYYTFLNDTDQWLGS